jgi:hypothetical protein
MNDNGGIGIEFQCTECGRHIIQICGPPPADHFGLCAACLMLPGWHADPELRRRLDPEGVTTDPKGG